MKKPLRWWAGQRAVEVEALSRRACRPPGSWDGSGAVGWDSSEAGRETRGHVMGQESVALRPRKRHMGSGEVRYKVRKERLKECMVEAGCCSGAPRH